MYTRGLTFLLFLSWISSVSAAEAVLDLHDFVPPDDGYDWIQLTSGEWLKGELIRMFDDEVKFDSDGLDMLYLDWEDVYRIRARGSYTVGVAGVGSARGELKVDGQRVLVTVAGRQTEFDRARLFTITESADRELDRWSADVTFGLDIRSGNTDIVEYNMLAGLERRTERSRLLLDYIGNFNETEREEVANNHRVNVSYDLFSGRRFFWRPIIGQYYRDVIQNIRHQGTVETGFGYELLDTPRTDWEITGSLGVNFVNFVSVEEGQASDNSSPAISFGTDFDTEVTAWLDYLFLFNMTFFDEESGRYQHHLLTTLSSDLIGNFDLDVSFVWDRTAKPRPRADGTVPEKDDYRLIVGLGYDF